MRAREERGPGDDRPARCARGRPRPRIVRPAITLMRRPRLATIEKLIEKPGHRHYARNYRRDRQIRRFVPAAAGFMAPRGATGRGVGAGIVIMQGLINPRIGSGE